MAFWNTHAAPAALTAREALIIINLQNDSLFSSEDVYITKNLDFVPRLKALVPHFRKFGRIIWVRTEFGPPSSNSSPDAARTEEEMKLNEAKNREEQSRHERRIQDDTRQRNKGSAEVLSKNSKSDVPKGQQTYHPSSRSKDMMMRASAKARSEQRSANMNVFNDNQNVWEEKLSKPRKGRIPKFYVTGTRGVEHADEIKEVVDQEGDLEVVKNYYSAFDQTGLLMILRTNLITTIYLAGCLTNVGIYATAADAVQHGINVVLVEDCLGYRSENKHEEAIRQMADIMGADGVDSEELIAKAGGNAPPDAEDEIFSGPGPDGITIGDLSINTPKQKKATLFADTKDADKSYDVKWSSQNVSKGPALSSPINPKLGGEPPRDSSNPERKSSVAMSEGVSSRKSRDSLRASGTRVMGPGDAIGSGDSKIIYNVLDSDQAKLYFAKLKGEIKWQTMHHRSGAVPRLVANQGEEHGRGGIPVYRHPADEMPKFLPFSPTVLKIRKNLEEALEQHFNHVLIQLYRDGNDNISEHSDKTLDIVRGSCVVNMSLGAQRAMTLRTKKSKRTSGTESPIPRSTQKVAMPHNSAFVLGLETNREWLHGVRADKRPDRQKTEDELAFQGERISLTFRDIGTFADEKGKSIWGQGARAKTKATAGKIRNNDNAEMEAMVIAFGRENHDANFDWDAEYGRGFDAINLVEAKAKVTLSEDTIPNLRVQLSLNEKDISYSIVEDIVSQTMLTVNEHRNTPYAHSLSDTQKIVFEDVDEDATRVDGDLSILFYLERVYPFVHPAGVSARQVHRVSALEFKRATQSNDLLIHWRNAELHLQSEEQGGESPPSETSSRREEQARPSSPNVTEFHRGIEMWEAYAGEADYIAASFWTIIDCAFWPVLHEIAGKWAAFTGENYPSLWKYNQRALARPSVKALVAAEERARARIQEERDDEKEQELEA